MTPLEALEIIAPEVPGQFAECLEIIRAELIRAATEDGQTVNSENERFS